MLETAHRAVPGLRIARSRKVARPADETTRAARLSASPAVPFPPPSGGVAPHRIPRLAAVACLARYVSSLAGVTFTPAQPPSVINSPCEKTNLTQKQPCGKSPRRDVAETFPSELATSVQFTHKSTFTT